MWLKGILLQVNWILSWHETNTHEFQQFLERQLFFICKDVNFSSKQFFVPTYNAKKLYKGSCLIPLFESHLSWQKSSASSSPKESHHPQCINRDYCLPICIESFWIIFFFRKNISFVKEKIIKYIFRHSQVYKWCLTLFIYPLVNTVFADFFCWYIILTFWLIFLKK